AATVSCLVMHERSEPTARDLQARESACHLGRAWEMPESPATLGDATDGEGVGHPRCAPTLEQRLQTLAAGIAPETAEVRARGTGNLHAGVAPEACPHAAALRDRPEPDHGRDRSIRRMA